MFDIQFMKQVFTALIRGYQMMISPWLPKSCRFYPTCSDYAIEALNQYGMMRGLWLSLKRMCRCHPWNPGGVDPVPGDRGRKTEDRSQKST
jgi:putative membrane protein insertion efficiency factor